MAKKTLKQLKKYKEGGTKKPLPPIEVTDPNDKRLRAYNDSNILYNATKNDAALLDKVYREHPTDMSEWHDYAYNWDLKNPKAGKAFDRLSKLNKDTPEMENVIYRGTGNSAGNYAKPVQPYKLVKKPEVPRLPGGYRKANGIYQNEYYNMPTAPDWMPLTYRQPLQQLNEIQPLNTRQGLNVPHLEKVDMLSRESDDTPKMYQGRQFMNRTGLRPGNYTEQQVNDAMKKKTVKMGKGGTLPKYGTGSTVGAAAGYAGGTALNLVAPGLGTVAAPILAAGGAWLGDELESKYFTKDKGDPNAEMEATNRMMGYNNNNTISPYTQTNTGNMYARGGVAGPNAEIENNELVQLPHGTPQVYNGGQLNQQSMDTYQADGNTHANGGIETGLPDGTRVFSDKVKYNGKTIAALAKPIASKIGSLEKKSEKSLNPAIKNTLERLNMQKDALFTTQEAIKEEQDMKKTMKSFRNGGLVKYLYGGPFQDDEEYYIGTDPNYKPTGPNAYNTALDGEDPNYLPPELGTRSPWVPKPTFSDKELGITSKPVPNMTGYSGTPGASTANTGGGASSFMGGSAGSQLGAAGAALVGSFMQMRNINKTPAPGKINALDAPMIDPFTRVDLTQERVDLNRDARSGRNDVLRNSGSFATQGANLGKIRASQLMGRGNINMREQNANTQIDNSYKQAAAEIRARNAGNKQAVDMQNMENKYNYDMWKAGQENAVISNLTGTGVGLFNNQTQHNNQLQYYDALSKGYTPDLLNRNKLNPRGYGKGGKVKSMKSLRK